MARERRVYSAAEHRELWERWKRGETVSDIARALVGGQALGFAGIDIGLFNPFAQSLIGDPKVFGDLGGPTCR
jgi:hypothetical protein